MRSTILELLVLLIATGATAQDIVHASPDVTVELGSSASVIPDEGIGLDDPLDLPPFGTEILPQPLGALPDSADLVGYVAVPGLLGDNILMSFDASLDLPGPLFVQRGDVVRYDGSTYTLEFDASSFGVPDGAVIDALDQTPGGLLLSFDTTVDLGGGLIVDDEDLVTCNLVTCVLSFDGSMSGIDRGLDVDAVHDLGGQILALSFDTGGTVGLVDFADEDVLRYDGIMGSWSMLYDASSVDANWAAADLDAVFLPEPAMMAMLVAGVALLGLLRRRGRRAGGVIFVIALALEPIVANAVDGVLEINQACAVSTGCFSGDTAGFPVTISSSGSYRLTGNLTVPDENTTAVQINASDITVDLNGFTILGPTICTVVPTSCSPTGTGDGVGGSTVFQNIRVLNGTIRGMGRRGVWIGPQSRVEGVHAISNGEIGLFPNSVCSVINSEADRNGGEGIRVGFQCLVINSIATFNGSFGLKFAAGSGYATNVVEENNGGNANPQVDGGLEIGANVCGGDLICP